MQYGNQSYSNGDQGRRDFQRYDSEEMNQRSGESGRGRGYGRDPYPREYRSQRMSSRGQEGYGRESGSDQGYERMSGYGREGRPDYGPSDRSDYEREQRFGYEDDDRSSRRSMSQDWGNQGMGSESDSERYRGSEWSSGRSSGRPRSWYGDQSPERSSYGGGFRGGYSSGSQGGQWTSQGWSNPTSSGREYGSGDRYYGLGRASESDTSSGRWQGGSMGGSMGGGSMSGSYDRGSSYGSSYGSFGGQSSMEDRGQHRGKGPKGYRRTDDRIKEDVNEALKQDDIIDASDITVQVREGVVTLSGEVDGRRAKRAAEDCVERLSGVEEVVNQLHVRKNKDSGTSSSSTSSQESSSQTNKNRYGQESGSTTSKT